MPAHAPSESMMWLGGLHLLSIPLAFLATSLLGCPDKRMLVKRLAVVSLLMSLPVLVILPFLPAMLGSGTAEAIVMLLVSPLTSSLVLLRLRRWQKK